MFFKPLKKASRADFREKQDFKGLINNFCNYMSPIFFLLLSNIFFYPYPAPQPEPDLHQHEKWDPDPHQKVLDPPQCYKQNIVTDLELYKNLNNLTANQTIVKVMSRV